MACVAITGCAGPQIAGTSSGSLPSAGAGTPAPTAANNSGNAAPASSEASGALAPFAWLAGCWQGNVNQREFREQWLPLRGGVLVGAGQQAMAGTIQDYEFLRIESRPDGVYFTQFSGDRRETSFRFTGTTTDHDDTIFTFASTEAGFPSRLIYRRGSEGWLYETVEGSLQGSEKRVIYPLRRVSCESGTFITK